MARKIEVLDVVEIDGVMYTVDPSDKKSLKNVYSAMVGALTVSLPSAVFAAEPETFHRVWESLMTGLDWAAALVIVFAGVAWMLGHRSKSIELLIGVSCGFIIARHAIDIRDFLKTI